MDKILADTKDAIKKKMNATTEDIYISKPIMKVVQAVVAHIDITTGPAPLKGHNTQEKAQKFDDIIAKVILDQGIVEVSKVNKKDAAISFTHKVFVGDHFGYNRTNVSKVTVLHLGIDTPQGVVMVRQPFGTQNNPDILLLHIIGDEETGKLKIHSYFGFEIKSGGTVWNTHIQHAKKNMIYIVYKTVKKVTRTTYFFGVDFRTREEFIHALAVDHIQRDLVKIANTQASVAGLRNNNVAYPKHEFKSKPFDKDNERFKANVRAYISKV